MSVSSAGGRGTLVYKAPELFTYPPSDPTTVDVYAFAILTWQLVTREMPYSQLKSAETAMPAMLAQATARRSCGDDWKEMTTGGLSKLIEGAWVQEKSERPAFGGDGGLRMLEKMEAAKMRQAISGDDLAVDTMLARVWAAESEKTPSTRCSASTMQRRRRRLLL